MSYAWTKCPSHLAMNIQPSIPKTEQPSRVVYFTSGHWWKSNWVILMQVTHDKYAKWKRGSLTNFSKLPQSSKDKSCNNIFLLVWSGLVKCFLVSDMRHQALKFLIVPLIPTGCLWVVGLSSTGCEFLTNVKVPLAALASRGCVMLGETSFQKPDLEETLQTVKCIQGLEVANLHLS